MSDILEEVKGLYQIIKLKDFRNTPGVTFDLIPFDILPKISSIDRVLHEKSAVSPGSIGNIKRPWYMHNHQEDNLVVLYGRREVDIYKKDHGKVEQFTVMPNSIYKNGKLLYEGGAMLVWPCGVFHRIQSGERGSASINFAAHYEGFDVKNNFDIYDLDTETGKFEVIRKGFEDQ